MPPVVAEVAGWIASLAGGQDEDSVRLLALALLTVLGEDGAPVAGGLWQPLFEALQVLCERYDKRFWEPLEAAGRYGGPESGRPLTGLVALLAEFGPVAGDPRKPAITPLGRWAAGHLAAGLAGSADPGLPAGEMIAEAARFGDEEQQDHVARAWLAEREPVRAARARSSPPPRACRRCGAAWLSAWWRRSATTRATGHPDAGPLARSVAEFAASGAPRSVDQVAQLKVALSDVRPPIWRRILVPATATLGDLHEVIQVLFDWDGDHLHVFESGKKRYADPLSSSSAAWN